LAGLLQGKKALVMGVANDRSIAWAIAQALYREGATLAFTYQGERLERRVRSLTENMEGVFLTSCDVTRDEEIDRVFAELKSQFGTLDVVVHSLAYAKAEDLEGEYVDTSRDGYALAQDISAYSLVAVARRARELMADGGSIITMTYLGAERVIPNYNVMGVAKAALEASVRYLASDLGKQGIRVNGISAGPIKTLAAKGVRGFNSVLQVIEEKSPLRRTTDVSEVADTALFLASHWSRGITGEIIHVDSGYHIMGM
jgi:enoyl-[acyl-carrier protein] reductase I